MDLDGRMHSPISQMSLSQKCFRGIISCFVRRILSLEWYESHRKVDLNYFQRSIIRIYYTRSYCSHRRNFRFRDFSSCSPWDQTSRIKCKFDERSKKTPKKRIILPKDDIYVINCMTRRAWLIYYRLLTLTLNDDPFFIIWSIVV